MTFSSNPWIFLITFSFPFAHTPILRQNLAIWINPANPSGDVGERTTEEKFGSGKEVKERDGWGGGRGQDKRRR